LSVSAAQVKELRERTGAGMMDCKRALGEVDGDMEAAIKALREHGLASASKKGGRVAAEGLVGLFVSDCGSRGVAMELNCETDFVAKTDDFAALVAELGQALLAVEGAAEGEGADVNDVALASGGTLAARVTEAVTTMGEKISLRRWVRIESAGGRVGAYVHAGGKIGVLVEIEGAGDPQQELCRSVAMQVAAAAPRYVDRDSVDPDEIEGEKEIYRNEALASGKPEKILDRIAEGRINKYFREICLLEQEYVRDTDLTISDLLEKESGSAGGPLAVSRFVRYQLGEGIERRVANLAQEVAEQISQTT
jgi:elongation factor Ts